MAWEDALKDLAARRAAAREQGGADAVAAHHEKGRLTIRERIDLLVDPGRFLEQGRAAGEGTYDDDGKLTGFTPANYVLGIGEIDSRPVVIGGEDFTLKGGSPNAAGLRKSVYAESLALQTRLPLVRLLEGGGGSVRGSGGRNRPSGEAVFGEPRFASIANVFNTVPVASAALGPVAGFPAARLAASHFSVMTKTASVMVAGPAVVERALGDRPTKEDLGGADVHAKSGVVDAVAEDEPAAIAQIRRFLSYMPSHVWEEPPVLESDDQADRTEDALRDAVPEDRRRAYDMRKIARLVFDRDSLFEMGKAYGRGLITMLARLQGRPVGVLANDCRHFAGAMTADGSQKTRRFVDLCNQFGLPIISLIDEPGFMIGPEAERLATIRYGTAAVMATVQSRVPWCSVVVRKAFGVAAAAHFGPGAYVLAWPSAEMGALPLEGGVAIAFGREIAAADDPEAKRRELEEMLSRGLSPLPRAETFSIHEVIDPAETRPMLCAWLSWAARPSGQGMGPYLPGPRP